MFAPIFIFFNNNTDPTKNAGIFLSKEGKADAQKQALEEAELQRLLKVYENFFNEDDQSPLTPSTPSAVVGGILMKYLESLPDPIIPREYYHTYTRVIRK